MGGVNCKIDYTFAVVMFFNLISFFKFWSNVYSVSEINRKCKCQNRKKLNMGQTNYLKLVWIAGFIIFAGISCLATAESLRLLSSSLPMGVWLAITIGIFIIASLGTKMIVDSLNQNITVENRNLQLIGGIVVTSVFWLLFSLPTNTHTFYYRSEINKVVTGDISDTRNYLSDILDNAGREDVAKRKAQEFRNEANSALQALTSEIKNSNNPGFGESAREKLDDLSKVLGVSIRELSVPSSRGYDRERLCENYRSQILPMIDDKARLIEDEVKNPSEDVLVQARGLDKDLLAMSKYIKNGTIDLFDPDDMTEQVCNKLNEAYSIIKQNKNFITSFDNNDKEIYTADTPMTKTNRMISVIDVWNDFFHGKLSGSFWTWIFLAVIVDIAAFAFFDLAFRKRNSFGNF